MGPERTTGLVRWVVVFSGTVGAGFACGWGAASVRVVVENCTVDASIFCFCAHLCRDFLMCVLVKLSRAHGGCLGIRSR